MTLVRFQNTSTGIARVDVGNNGAAATVVIWDNVTVKFAAVSGTISPFYVEFTWRNTGQVLVSGSSVPTNLIKPPGTSGQFNTVALEALDLSQLTGNCVRAQCDLDASVPSLSMTASSTPPPLLPRRSTRACKFRLSAPIAARQRTSLARYAYEGTETTETSITRVGGAVDPTGQAQTRKIVTTANAQWLRPFQAEPYAIWNTVTGATVTVTVYGTINAGAVPNNDDIWIEVEYLGSSAYPAGHHRHHDQGQPACEQCGGGLGRLDWNGGGRGAGWSPFKLVATLSSPQPGMAGYIDVRVRAAKASTTYYIDPKIDLT